MSAPIRTDDLNQFENAPSMYAPPWARDEARVASDAGLAAVDKALQASDQLRRTLPPAAPLQNPRRQREPKPFEGDVAARHMRHRPTLDPIKVAKPVRKRGLFGTLARASGAVGLAALAAVLVVSLVPNPIQSAVTEGVMAADEQAPFAERIGALAVPAVIEQASASPAAIPATATVPAPSAMPAASPAIAVTTTSVPAPLAPPARVLRTLDREEIAMLYRRSEVLIKEGDIAAARLMLSRAAEAGDARAAFALGATYDSDVLRKLNVVGVTGDVAQARAWYEKAAEYGDAGKKLELAR